MFALRGLDVSFAVFVLIYCVLSLAVTLTWRKALGVLQQNPVHRVSNVLFALRMFPLITAALITAAFTVPSFLLLEPRAINEPMEGFPLALGITGLALGVYGIYNAIHALIRANRNVSEWTRDSESAEASAPVPVVRIRRSVPAMTAAGILHPKVLVSGSAEFMLTPTELQVALNHEVAHVRRRDNLKKLLMRFVAFPGMGGLESAWLEATEMAADDAAVSNTGEALDLAAALIKLSRLSRPEESSDLTAALIHSPASLMNARIERLIAWNEDRRSSSSSLSIRYGAAAALVTLLVFVHTYGHLISKVHTATEWLMR